ncbi:MAG: hypothetical protein ABH806_02375 [Candidatus Omnitrophota bacterium]
MNLVTIIIVVVVVIIIWVAQSIKTGKMQILSDKKKQKEDLETAARRSRLAKEDMLEQKEVIKHRTEVDKAEREATENRKLREEELRQKIEERKRYGPEEDKTRKEEIDRK